MFRAKHPPTPRQIKKQGRGLLRPRNPRAKSTGDVKTIIPRIASLANPARTSLTSPPACVCSVSYTHLPLPTSDIV
ncbi:MAG: hypothetical protein MPK62_10275 [Alphaproteobacteria bacterium]|nr:hypothetical protein [Alphaproteobacteria bacterium]